MEIFTKSSAVVLAPMEGVTDAPMRKMLTQLGGYAFCVSEFVRISQNVPSPRAFRHAIPELKSGAKTANGTPVLVQILGGNPELMAASAQSAVQAGATGIDINFGCPAPTVNKHDGGATLLKYPDRIRTIVAAVRAALPKEISVSAKLRLGWDDPSTILRNADCAAEGGASWITIHGRTKEQGYRPPAHWEPIGEVRKRLNIPVIANGDIWTIEDFRRCRDITGCSHFMLGRSALADPYLALRMSAELEGKPLSHNIDCVLASPHEWEPLLSQFAKLCEAESSRNNYALARIKQWLNLAEHRQKQSWMHAVKRAPTLPDAFQIISDWR